MVKAKKVLSIVVALMLLCNVFTVLSSAAVADDRAVAIAVKTDKESYLPGETAIVSFYIEGSTRGGYDLTKVSSTDLPMGWDNTVLSIDAADRASLLVGGALDIDVANSGIRSLTTDLDSSETALGWNEILNFGIILNEVSVCDDINEVAFSIPVLIDENAAYGDYKIGISEYRMSNVNEEYSSALNSAELGDGIYNNCYEADLGVVDCYDLSQAVTTIKVAAAAAKPIKVVTTDDGVQWRTNASNADAIDIGVKAQFTNEDLGITFNDFGTSENVKEVGATLKVNGVDAGTVTSPFVYDINGDGSVYQFRAIIENVAKDSTDTYTVTFFATMMDGTPVEGETIDVTAAMALA